MRSGATPLPSAPQPPVPLVFRAHLSRSRKKSHPYVKTALLFPFCEAVGSSNNFFVKRKHTQKEGEGGREGGREEGEGERGVEGVGDWRRWGRLLTAALFLDPVILSFRFQSGLWGGVDFFFSHLLFSACKQIAKSKVKLKLGNFFARQLPFFFASSGTLGDFCLCIPASFGSTIGLFCQPSRLQCVLATNRDFCFSLRGSAVSKSRLSAA